jgi:WD40 repeat protein
MISTPITLGDDYTNDIKPDQTVPSFNDSVSHIAWAPNGAHIFATTSWDGELRVFEVTQEQYQAVIIQKLSYKFNLPALKCTWNDQCTQIYVGLMDGTIKAYDIGSSQTGDIGKHSVAISSLHFVPGMNTVVSSGY